MNTNSNFVATDNCGNKSNVKPFLKNGQKKAPSAARLALIRISNEIRKRNFSSLKINEVLRDMYSRKTSQTDFDTFKGWKERGYIVNKGAKGFPVWSKPIEAKKENEAETEQTPENEAPQPLNFWAKFRVAYLFHAGQVHDKFDRKPGTFKTLCLPAPIPDIFKADIEIIANPEPEKIEPSTPIFTKTGQFELVF